MDNGYNNLYGYWQVTTEGDCEGRSIRVLGTFHGWVDDIAFHLADECYYSLRFTKISDERQEMFVPKAKAINISFDSEAGTWNMNSSELAKHVQKVFDDNKRDVYVEVGAGYATVLLNLEKNEDEIKRNAALKKLTDEEKRLLGL